MYAHYIFRICGTFLFGRPAIAGALRRLRGVRTPMYPPTVTPFRRRLRQLIQVIDPLPDLVIIGNAHEIAEAVLEKTSPYIQKAALAAVHTAKSTTAEWRLILNSVSYKPICDRWCREHLACSGAKRLLLLSKDEYDSKNAFDKCPKSSIARRADPLFNNLELITPISSTTRAIQTAYHFARVVPGQGDIRRRRHVPAAGASSEAGGGSWQAKALTTDASEWKSC